MKIKTTEINVIGKLILVIGRIIEFSCLTIVIPMILVLNIVGTEPVWVLLVSFIIISILPFLIILTDIDSKFDSWIENNFSHSIIKETLETKRTNQSFSHIDTNMSEHKSNNCYSSKASVYNTQKDTYDTETKLNDYIMKETDKIIKTNNITDTKDKEAARLFAFNNIRHSPKIISDIYNMSLENAKEVEESISVKEEKKVANHIAYEGRISIKDKNKIKSLLGYKCAACGKDMSEIYGDLGHNYIELHHKIPYSDMKENETRTLTDKEFCVLCPDCHRMIHKLPNAYDIDVLERIIKLHKKS